MKQNLFKIALLAIGLILFAVTVYLYSPNRTRYTRITVVGDSQTKVAPDTALITFSVVTQGKQALDVQQENARKSEAVKTAVEAIKENAEIEVKTSNYNLSPDYDYSGKMPKISGYEVKNTVSISINDLTQVGAVIDAATRAGANSVEGIRFVLGETSPAQGDALGLATKQALAKAESIAKSLNGRVVRVLETHEFGAPQLPSSSERYAAMNSNMSVDFKQSYSTPIQSGSLDIQSKIVLVVEVEIG